MIEKKNSPILDAVAERIIGFICAGHTGKVVVDLDFRDGGVASATITAPERIKIREGIAEKQRAVQHDR